MQSSGTAPVKTITTPAKTVAAPAKTVAAPTKNATAAPKNKQEIDKKAKSEAPAKNTNLYTGVIFEQTDDEKPTNSGSHSRKTQPDYTPTERTSSSSFKSPNISNKKTNKEPETAGSTALSTALEYIRSPVKYITSVFSSQPQEPEKSQGKSDKLLGRNNRGQLKSDFKQVPTVVKSKDALPQKKTEATLPQQVSISGSPPVEAETKTSQDILKDKSGELAQSFMTKDSTLFPKTQDNKKSLDPKRSQSQMIKTAPKSYIAASPRNIVLADMRNKKQTPSPSPKFVTNPNVKIQESNRLSYRVTSAEDVQVKAKKDSRKVFKYDKSASLTSGMNNSSKRRLSTTMRAETDELLFSQFSSRPVIHTVIHNCSNTMSRNWKIAGEEPYSLNSALGEFRSKSLASPLTFTQTIFNRNPTVLHKSSHDRESSPGPEDPSVQTSPASQAGSKSLSSDEQSEKSDYQSLENFPLYELQPTVLVTPGVSNGKKPHGSPELSSPAKKSEEKKAPLSNSEIIFVRLPSPEVKKRASPGAVSSPPKKKTGSPGKAKNQEKGKSKGNKSPTQSPRAQRDPPSPQSQNLLSPSFLPSFTSPSYSPREIPPSFLPTRASPPPPSPSQITPSFLPRRASPPHSLSQIPPSLLPRPPSSSPPRPPSSSPPPRPGSPSPPPRPGSPSPPPRPGTPSSPQAVPPTSPSRPSSVNEQQKPVYVFDGTVYQKISPKSKQIEKPSSDSNSTYEKSALAVAAAAVTEAATAVMKAASGAVADAQENSSPTDEQDPRKENKESWFTQALKSLSPGRKVEETEVDAETQNLEAPEVTKETSKAPTEAPDVAKREPEIITDEPEVIMQTPEITPQMPAVTDRRPEIPISSANLPAKKNQPDLTPTVLVESADMVSEQINGSDVDAESEDENPLYFAPSASMLGEFN